MNLALFDFDGTITERDSFLDFLLKTQGGLKVVLGTLRLAPTLLRHVAGFINEKEAKSAVLHHFFGNAEKPDFMALCSHYSKHKLSLLVRENALLAIHEHQKQGDRVIVVSASLDSYLRPWCESMGVELLATLPAFDTHNRFAGIEGANCKGKEKVRRIQQILSLEDYETIYAYGDSSGDTAMLALAHHAHYKPFR